MAVEKSLEATSRTAVGIMLIAAMVCCTGAVVLQAAQTSPANAKTSQKPPIAPLPPAVRSDIRSPHTSLPRSSVATVSVVPEGQSVRSKSAVQFEAVSKHAFRPPSAGSGESQVAAPASTDAVAPPTGFTRQFQPPATATHGPRDPHRIGTSDIPPRASDAAAKDAYAGETGEYLSLSLDRAIAAAVANSEVVRVLEGRQGTAPQATSYDYAIAGSRVESSWGRFDPRLDAGVYWERDDLPPSFTELGTFRRRSQLDQADGSIALTQPLLFGGNIGVAYDVNYTFFPPENNPGGLLNPQYYSPVTMFFSQPLWQGAGTHVGEAPILISAAGADQSAWQFKDAVLALLRSVEQAYWNLHAARVDLNAIDDVLELHKELIRVNRERAAVDAIAKADVAQVETRMYEFERLRIQALNELQTQENLLRNVLGLPPDDRRRILLSDAPKSRRPVIDWQETLAVAMTHRPDIMRQRLAVRVRELEQLLAADAYRPRLDASGFWRINGLGDDLNDATDLLFDNRFADWNLGFTLSVPLGRSEARGRLRAARFSLARDRALLNQTEHQAAHELASLVRDLNAIYQQRLAAAKSLSAAQRWVEGARARYLQPAGAGSLETLNNYLQALREYAESLRRLGRLDANYETVWARLEEAKGTLLSKHRVALDLDCCRAAALRLEKLAAYAAPEDLRRLETVEPEQLRSTLRCKRLGTGQ